MPCKFKIWLLISLFCAASAYAEIPLDLVQSIQLPVGLLQDPLRSWDVQHWSDDQSYGWAAIVDSHIVYTPNIQTPPQSFLVSDSLFPNAWGDSWTPAIVHRAIRICRRPDADSSFCILLYTQVGYLYDNGYSDMHQNRINTLSLFDIPSVTRIFAAQFDAYQASSGHDSYGRSATTNQIFCWPPPPLPALSIVVSQSYVVSNSYFTPMRTYYSTYGNVNVLDLAVYPPVLHGSSRCEWATPFIRPNSYSIVGYANLYSRFWIYYGDETQITSYKALTRVCMTPYTSTWDTTYYAAVITQTDGDGIGHLIARSSGNTRTAALSESGSLELWANSTLAGDLYTARMADSPDERILTLQGSSQRFAVFSAANGQFLDSTISMSGTLQFMIKRPAVKSEFVTFDSPTRTIRIYKPGYGMTGVSCTYLPETDRIRLYWSPLPGATSYRIYSGAYVTDSPYQVLGVVDAPRTSFDFVPEPAHRFFYVTALYGNP
jgi:hypothetical protein